ncbi:conserved domain protein [Haemophilus parainfluenzae ATCC 33392]|uniref:Beta-ketoacyl synthase N-terminal domain-containing protein n=1 Tax=Haemophilus parainfluenzae ATCC 33392 TaxID=888828 RepID=A0ABD7ZDY8_HAEPA|nr:hypothetical protein [Haemophilus parainfluenzae]EGC72712.1 hypothetical protein HMPREF9417_0587 [Haemophilus parainfluenzae ATCC 33392]KFL99438.1 conserved domain protein [Haemophilus parainfluenzae ATCC 33392]QQB23189.1 hypothetical protein I6H57_00680 [Haemophilus parainfluenzae]WMS22961.1 hypothetical protein RDV53_05775 [Haemophilus parainfluenzae ATCC 33392]STO94419.1 Uncharacterised protein [Haemophilus parainfluenzae ATCC 33392]
MTFYIKQTNQFIANGVDDKTLRLRLKEQGLEARRLSRFTQLALLGAIPLKPYINENTGIYLGSFFNSPSKFDKMFHQLMEQNVPSPLDFMANINNAATFQLTQTLQTSANSVFLAINHQTIWQPLKLALLDLENDEISSALIGWTLEKSEHSEQTEGAVFWLISKNKEDAEIEFNLLSLENSMSKNLDFLSQIKK